MTKVLVTGGAGFIGSNFTKELLKDKDYQVIVLDKLTYAGNLDNFSEEIMNSPRFEFIKGDIVNRTLVSKLIKRVDVIINFAAETHIDRSIVDITPFVKTDFIGAFVLLDEFRKNPRERFIQISTSEVYGSAQSIPMTENHPIAPQSPYAATKASADRMAYAFFQTYKLPIVIVRPFNNYGPNQYPEKLLPFFITNAIENKPLFVYGTGKNTRDWIYVKDCAQALKRILEIDVNKIKGEVFNIGSGKEYNVLQIADIILNYFNKPKSFIKMIADRPGHVERLISSTKKSKEILKWEPKTEFTAGILKTIKWYEKNIWWWQKIKKRKEYQRFYQQWYEQQLKTQH
ncbi:MAG: dTDP-glucose 4,6-dehydratase [candidate division WOR-3 bacterium]|nr:dTDP-glucose 4,6-dehydratase [candidate division WOR-3 bacterium]